MIKKMWRKLRNLDKIAELEGQVETQKLLKRKIYEAIRIEVEDFGIMDFKIIKEHLWTLCND